MVFIGDEVSSRKLQNVLTRSTDKNEGLGYIYHNARVTIDPTGQEHVMSKETGLINVSFSPNIKWNIYCMFSILNFNGRFNFPLIDKRNYELGDTIAVISDAKVFIGRFKKAIKKIKRAEERAVFTRLIEYIDLGTHDGPVGPFRKDKKYSHQNEFRIAVQAFNNLEEEPLIVQLGDMRDLITLYDIQTASQVLRIDIGYFNWIFKPISVINFPRAEIISDHPLIHIGDFNIANQNTTAFFCSNKCPGDLILRTYDLAQAWRDKGEAIIGGFHTSVEKDVLDILMKGEQPLVICPARSIGRMRLPKVWKAGITARRLLILSPFDNDQNRVTAKLAEERNRFVAAIADSLFIAYAHPGGKTEALARHAIEQGKPVTTFNHPATENLREMGAVGVEER